MYYILKSISEGGFEWAIESKRQLMQTSEKLAKYHAVLDQIICFLQSKITFSKPTPVFLYDQGCEEKCLNISYQIQALRFTKICLNLIFCPNTSFENELTVLADFIDSLSDDASEKWYETIPQTFLLIFHHFSNSQQKKIIVVFSKHFIKKFAAIIGRDNLVVLFHCP